MILNGKALEDFRYKYNMSNFNEYSEVLQNALIIEFFDSVGVYIGIYPATNFSQYLMFEISINDDWIGEEENRQEATIQAIKKANDLYNNTDKV